MKGIIFAIGGIAAVGVIAYELYKLCNYREANNANNISATEYCQDGFDLDLARNNKEEAAKSIKERHEEAAKSIIESIGVIFNDSQADDVETENSGSLDKINGGLDELLK